MSRPTRRHIGPESAVRWMQELRPATTTARLGMILIVAMVLLADDRTDTWVLAAVAAYVAWFCFNAWRERSGRASPSDLWFMWTTALGAVIVVRLTEHHTLLLLVAAQPIVNCTVFYGARKGMALAGVLVAVLLVGWDPPGLLLHNGLAALGFLLLPPIARQALRPLAALRQRMQLVEDLQREQDPRRGLQSVGLSTAEGLRSATGAQRVVICHRDAERPTVLVSDDDEGPYPASSPLAERLLQGLERLPVQPMALDLRKPGAEALLCDDTHIDRPAAIALIRDLAEVLGTRFLQLAPDAPGHARSGWVLVAHARPSGPGAVGAVGAVGARPWPLRTLAAFAQEMRMLLQQASYVDVLQAEIAAHERERIGRDLHDSALQPYLGLKFAIESLAINCPPGNPMHGRAQELRQFCDTELAELRETVLALRSGQTGGENTLVPALRRQARRYAGLFGIQTELQVPDRLPTTRALSGAILHMVNEALNNARRHTQARQVWISLKAEPDRLHLVVRDDAAQRSGQPAPDFEPRSLSERVRELGGSLQLRRHQGLDTEIHISVPI